MWYVRDVLYAVLYVRVSCFVVCGCGVSRRYVDVCYCDMFSVVNVYLDHLKFCVVYINSRRYVCCSECNFTYQYRWASVLYIKFGIFRICIGLLFRVIIHGCHEYCLDVYASLI